MRISFFLLAVGEAFHVNGTPYVKKSARTAFTSEGHPAHAAGKWFWFGQNEIVDNS